MNMNLRELYLADNKLNGLQDSAQLGNLLKFNYNIQILDLRNNHILDSGMMQRQSNNTRTFIIRWFHNGSCHKILPQRGRQVFESLGKLSTDYSKYFCFIFTGLAYVCEGLKEQRKGLVTLVLWNNQLTHNGMGYLAAALV